MAFFHGLCFAPWLQFPAWFFLNNGQWPVTFNRPPTAECRPQKATTVCSVQTWLLFFHSTHIRLLYNASHFVLFNMICCCFLPFFWVKVSLGNINHSSSHYVACIGLGLVAMLLLQSSKCWAHRHVPPHQHKQGYLNRKKNHLERHQTNRAQSFRLGLSI